MRWAMTSVSVSEENVQRVIEYIKNQKKHHAAKTRVREYEMTQDWNGTAWLDSEIFCVSFSRRFLFCTFFHALHVNLFQTAISNRWDSLK